MRRGLALAAALVVAAACGTPPGPPIAPTTDAAMAGRKPAADAASLVVSFASDGAFLLVVDASAASRAHRLYRVPDFAKPHRELRDMKAVELAGRWLVSESDGGTIAIEDPATGRRIAALPKRPTALAAFGTSETFVLFERSSLAELSVVVPGGSRQPVSLAEHCPSGLVPREAILDYRNDHLLLFRLQCEPAARSPCSDDGLHFDGCEGSVSRWMFLAASAPTRARPLGESWDRPILVSGSQRGDRLFVGSQPFSESRPAFGAIFGADGSAIAQLHDVPEDVFRCAALSADGKRLAVVMSRTVNVFATDTGLLHARVETRNPDACHAVLSTTHVATATSSAIRRWSLPPSPELSDLVELPPTKVERDATSVLMPPGPIVAWAYADHTVVYDLETMKRRDLGEGGWLDIDPRGRFLVTGSKIWDLASGTELADLR